ncbi:MAG: ATP-binding protein, partial [Anaerolineaceae bacterium]|nr:ATP-binding protein [Anaerolineaceae bacterium]
MRDLQYFTDRETQIDAFDDLWKTETPWILVFSGVSGNGKSTLIDWLIENKCKPQDIVTVKVDMYFSGGLDLSALLTRLVFLLKPAAAKRFRSAQSEARNQYNQDLTNLLKAKAARSIDVDLIADHHSQIDQSPVLVQDDTSGEDKLRNMYNESLITAFVQENHNLSCDRTVLFLDTFERAQDNTPKKELGFFWAFLEQLHHANPQLRVIIGGREDLT